MLSALRMPWRLGPAGIGTRGDELTWDADQWVPAVEFSDKVSRVRSRCWLWTNLQHEMRSPFFVGIMGGSL